MTYYKVTVIPRFETGYSVEIKSKKDKLILGGVHAFVII